MVERRGLPVEPARRSEVVVVGAVVLDAILCEGGLSEWLVSERDILDGLAASLR